MQSISLNSKAEHIYSVTVHLPEGATVAAPTSTQHVAATACKCAAHNQCREFCFTAQTSSAASNAALHWTEMQGPKSRISGNVWFALDQPEIQALRDQPKPVANARAALDVPAPPCWLNEIFIKPVAEYSDCRRLLILCCL